MCSSPIRKTDVVLSIYRKLGLISSFLILAYGFWVNPDLKPIAAGVAIFLFGMMSLEEGFKTFTGGLLERILKKTTNRLWKSVSFGIISTTIMQSSSLVSVISISFLSAGLITLASGIGIIFGANLGTTTGAWLVAGFGLKVKISAYAMPMLVFGVILTFQKQKEFKGLGYILTGLGFLFLGIHYMKEGFEVFRDQIDLTAYAISGYAGVLLYTLIGMVATVIMQSSHATLVLIITALASQQITYDNALALAIGSNVGTTITAILGAISASTNGKRLAVAHLIFNVITGILAIAFIYQLLDAVNWVAQILGIAQDNDTLKLAVFHTIFNLIGVAALLPFNGLLVKLLTRLLPEKKKALAEPKHLFASAIEIPDTAVEVIRKETMHLYSHFFNLTCHGLNFHISDIHSEKRIKDIVEKNRNRIEVDIDQTYDNNVKYLYSEIVTFSSLAQINMSPEQSERVIRFRNAGRDMLVAIKDTKHLDKNLSQHLHGPNPTIRSEYDLIRRRLGSILRRLWEIETEYTNEGIEILSLDAMRLEIEMSDRDFFTEVDKLIRDDLITGQVATSLMNDSRYANNLAYKLLAIGSALFEPSDPVSREIQESLFLTDAEMEEVMDSSRKNVRDRGGKVS